MLLAAIGVACDNRRPEASHQKAIQQPVFMDFETGEFFRCTNCDLPVFSSGDTLLFRFKLDERLELELPARRAVGVLNGHLTKRVIGIRVK